MAKPPTSPEFDRFTAVVDQVLSAPKPSKLSEERKLQDLRYLREEIEAEERRKSQIIPIPEKTT